MNLTSFGRSSAAHREGLSWLVFMSWGSGEGGRGGGASCLLVARLKVCSVTERGPGGGCTSSSWSARGVGDGG